MGAPYQTVMEKEPTRRMATPVGFCFPSQQPRQPKRAWHTNWDQNIPIKLGSPESQT